MIKLMGIAQRPVGMHPASRAAPVVHMAAVPAPARAPAPHMAPVQPVAGARIASAQRQANVVNAPEVKQLGQETTASHRIASALLNRLQARDTPK